MTRAEEIAREIATLEDRIVFLGDELKQLTAEETEAEAYKNFYNSFNDGIKFTNTVETAIEIVFPMCYIANLYYKRIEFDGVKNVEKIYVCMPMGDVPLKGILTAENFDSVMVEM